MPSEEWQHHGHGREHEKLPSVENDSTWKYVQNCFSRFSFICLSCCFSSSMTLSDLSTMAGSWEALAIVRLLLSAQCNTGVLLQSTWHRLLLSAEHNCFTSVNLTQVTAVCTTQLFHFSLPTGYCCLQNAIVSLQSTWHWLVLSVQHNCSTSLYLILVIGYCCAQHNCFTSVYLIGYCTTQLFHFSLSDRLLLSAQHNCFTSVYLQVTAVCTIVSLQSTYRLLLSAQSNCFTSVQPDT